MRLVGVLVKIPSKNEKISNSAIIISPSVFERRRTEHDADEASASGGFFEGRQNCERSEQKFVLHFFSI